MGGQASLFDAARPRARVVDPSTSHRAADAVAATAGSTRDDILAAHASHPDGLTDDELARLIPHRPAHTVKTARSRLAKAGLLAASGVERPSDCGQPSTVWRVAAWPTARPIESVQVVGAVL